MTQLTELKKVEFNGKSIRVFSDGATEWYVLTDIFNAVPGSTHKVTYASRFLIENHDPSIYYVTKGDINEPKHPGSPKRIVLNQKALKYIVDKMDGSPFEGMFSELYTTVVGEQECTPVKVMEKVSTGPQVSTELKMSEQDKGRQIIMELFGDNTPPVHEFDGNRYNKVVDIATCLGMESDSLTQIINRDPDSFKLTMRKEYLTPTLNLKVGQSKVYHYILLDMEGVSLLFQKIQAEQTNLSDEVKKNIVKYQQYQGAVTAGIICGEKEFMENLTGNTAKPELPTNAFTYTPFLPLFEEMIGMSDVLVKKGLISVSQGAVVALQETAYITKVDMSKYITLIESGNRVIGLPGSSDIDQIIQKFDMQNEEMMSTMTAMSQDIASIKMLPEAKDAEIAELKGEVANQKVLKDAEIGELRGKVDDMKVMLVCIDESYSANGLSSALQKQIKIDTQNIYANKGR